MARIEASAEATANTGSVTAKWLLVMGSLRSCRSWRSGAMRCLRSRRDAQQWIELGSIAVAGNSSSYSPISAVTNVLAPVKPVGVSRAINAGASCCLGGLRIGTLLTHKGDVLVRRRIGVPGD